MTLQDRRRAVGLSRRMLAVRAGLSHDTVRRIEQGDIVRPNTAWKLEKALREAETERGMPGWRPDEQGA